MLWLKQINNSKWRNFLLYFMLPIFAVTALSAIIQPFINSSGISLLFSYIFQLGILAIVFGVLVKLAVNWLREIGYLDEEMRYVAGFMMLAFIILTTFLYFFFQNEQDIRIYDQSLFWREALRGRSLFDDSINKYLVTCYNSLGGEYSILAAFPLIILSYLFGTSFTGYTISVLFAYYLPTCFFLTVFSLRLIFSSGLSSKRIFSFVVCFCVCALNVALIFPVLLGYLDIAGVLIIALLLNFTLHWDPTQLNIKMNMALAAFTVLLLVTRSWYEVYVVGFYLAFALYAFCMMLREQSFNGEKIGFMLLNYLSIFLVTGLCVWMLGNNSNIFAAFWQTDYAAAFANLSSSANIEGFLQGLVVNPAGICWLLAAAVGLVVLLSDRNIRLVALRLFTAMIVAVVLVLLVREIYWPRIYLIFPTLIIFVSALTAYIMHYSVKHDKVQPVGAIFLVGIVLCNFLFAYVPTFRPFMYSSSPYTVNFSHEVTVNPYAPVIRQVNAALREKIGDTNKKVFVVGETSVLSTALLKCSDLPDAVDSAPYVYNSTSASLFPSNLFTADYVLLTDPVAKGDLQRQEISKQIQDMLVNDLSAHKYYVLDEEFAFPEETTEGSYKLFRKIKAVDGSIVQNLSNRIRPYHADTPSAYQPNMFIALFRVDNQTEYDYHPWSGQIVLNKKADRVMRFRLENTKGYSKLSFRLSNWAKGITLTVSNQAGDITSVPVRQEKDALYEFEIKGSDFVRMTILQNDVPKQNNADIRITPATNSLS